MILPILLCFLLAVGCSYVRFPSPAARQRTYLLLGAGLILLAVFKQGEGLPDYQGFVENIEGDTETTLEIKEPAFFAIRWVADRFPGQRVLVALLLYALLGVATKLAAIRRLTDLWFLALAVYISNFYMLHDLIQVRAGVASGLLLLCIRPLEERNLRRFLPTALAAMLFHYSAIVILPLWLLNPRTFRKWLWAALIPAAGLLHFAGLDLLTLATHLPIPGIQVKIEVYRQITELGLNGWDAFDPFAATFLARVGMLYLLILCLEPLQRHNRYTRLLLKIYAVALASFLLLGNVPVVAARTRELLSIVEIVLLPSLTYLGRPRWLTRAIPAAYSLLILLLLLFGNHLLDREL